jgi:hypothetical protein
VTSTAGIDHGNVHALTALHRKHEGERHEMHGRHMQAHLQMHHRHHEERHAMHQRHEAEVMGGGGDPAAMEGGAPAADGAPAPLNPGTQQAA